LSLTVKNGDVHAPPKPTKRTTNQTNAEKYVKTCADMLIIMQFCVRLLWWRLKTFTFTVTCQKKTTNGVESVRTKTQVCRTANST